MREESKCPHLQASSSSRTTPALDNDCLRHAETTVRTRLWTALHREQLLVDPTSSEVAEDIAAIQSRDSAPAEQLRALAQRGYLRVKATNVDRACAEIADGVTGLARARAGIDARWKGTHRATKPAAPFSLLIEAMRRRCTPGDASASAMLARCEQLVCEGHPAHPAAKTSLGIGDAWPQVLPEQAEHISLRVCAVRRHLTTATGESIIRSLRTYLPKLWQELAEDMAARHLTEEEYDLIPVHPFQWSRVINQEFSEEITRGDIVLLDTVASAEPLMSVRTVRVCDGVGSMHMKLALEVQLTGAVRGISAGAVAAADIGEIIGRILRVDTGFIPRTNDDQPGFSVARDVAAIRFQSDTGIRARCLGAVLREDPAGELDEVAMPVATLLATNPLTGRRVFEDLLEEYGISQADWAVALGKLLFVPVAALLARWGIALEPHPQNTVVVVRNGLPHRVVVRDVGGCRLLADGPLNYLPGASELLDRLSGTALVEQDVLRLVDKVFYPLVANLYRHLFQDGSDERMHGRMAGLLAAEYWRTRASKLGHDGLVKRVFGRLLGEQLPVKRVLAMRLTGSVTEQDYVYEPNPLSAPELLTDSFLTEKVHLFYGWAQAHVWAKVRKAAQEEALDSASLEALRGDIANATRNLAVVRHQVQERAGSTMGTYWQLLRGLPVHAAMVTADSLGISGHNVHPLAKLRRGFTLEESVAYGSEAQAAVDLRFIAVSYELVEFSSAGNYKQFLDAHFPEHIRYVRQFLTRGNVTAQKAHEFVVLPVHPWQLEHVIVPAYSEEIAAGGIVIIPQLTLASWPTVSLRTLIPHAPSALGKRPFIKCAVDVVLTSTRRSISQESALGTPRVAGMVCRALADVQAHYGASPRVRAIPELCGAACARGLKAQGSADAGAEKARQRGLSVLIRDDAANYLAEGEIAISASALRGHEGVIPSPLADLVFFRDYVFDLVSTVLPLMFYKGIALEQHLQNTMVRIDITGSTPLYRGLLLRDFSGLRAWRPRLASWCPDSPFEPHALTLTNDYEEFLNKGFYACMFGNIDGIVDELVIAQGRDRAELWRVVSEEIQRYLDSAPQPIPSEDIRRLRGATLRRKGFLSMGLSAEGCDIYVEVPNPLVAG